MLKPFSLATIAFLTASVSHAQHPVAAPETHAFQLKAEVHYRCFGGYPPKLKDSRTQVPCDNKTYSQVLFDERISLRIQQEPSPDNSPTLAGAISRTREFRGRHFSVTMSLFKDMNPGQPVVYRLYAEADDDEPAKRRETTLGLRATAVKHFNPLQISYDSRGQPEEIQYRVTIEPAP